MSGDSLDKATVAALMDGEKAQMVFTDPPYNVPIDGHVSGLGSQKHREFAMASGEMSNVEFTGFLRTAFENLKQHSFDIQRERRLKGKNCSAASGRLAVC